MTKNLIRLAAATLVCTALTLGLNVQAQTTKAKDTPALQTPLAQAFVTVNGEAQPNARAEVLLREQIGRGIPDSVDLRKAVRAQLINQAMMAQEARKVALDKEPLVQAQIDLARQAILAQAWQQKVLSEVVVKDEDIKAEYQRQVIRLGTQEYLLRHLLVADESTAKLLIDKLQAGSKMAELASEYSRDASTKDRGGLTEWTPAGNLLPPIADAVAKLDQGKIAAKPISSAAGWHVLQVEEKRMFSPPTLVALTPQLTQIIARQVLESRAQALMAQTKVQ
jgi:peptidyl-prolyl cis-trans isomerase C